MNYTLYVKGMHCISCEVMIQKSLEEMKGVKVLLISNKTGVLKLDISSEKQIVKIEKTIKSLGYEIGKDDNNSCSISSNKKIWKDKKSIFQILFIMLGWAIVFMILKKFNITKLLPNIQDNVTLGVALVMGIVASLSTCLAVTGSIILGLSQYADDSTGSKGHLKTQISFQLGRVVGFFVLGGVLGIIGQVFKMSLTLNAILSIIVGVIVFYMGLNLVGVVPSITKLGFHLPKSRTRNILTTKNPAFAPIIGALTFFLPCGFTQSMQLVAMNSGGFFQGGLVMSIFAIGTLPILMAVGLGVSFIKEKKLAFIYKIIGVLVIFFGIYSVSNGLGILPKGNAPIDLDTGNNNVCNLNGNDTCEYEKIEISHDGWGLVPEVTNLKAGLNYEITILPKSNGKGCMNNLVIPKISNTVYDVIKGQAITYKIENIKAGTYKVVCGNMGMYQGEIVVE